MLTTDITEITPDGEETFTTSFYDYVKKTLPIELNLIINKSPNLAKLRWEQWNDGSNMLAIKPDVAVGYACNTISNTTAREHGVEVLEIKYKTLTRARGGPHCMTMPLYRKSTDTSK